MQSIAKFALTSAVLALGFVSLASAQTMRVSVPFGFRACSRVLPAGDYRVELNRSNRQITLRSLDGSQGCFMPVKAFEGPGSPSDGALVFNSYGDRNFLTRVKAPGAVAGAALFADRAEQEVAKVEGNPRSVLIPASSM